MKKVIVLSAVIILMVSSSTASAAMLIWDVHAGDGAAAIGVWRGEPYCSVQRGCSPAGFPTYLIYNGSELTEVPPWLGSYQIAGYLNGSWILQRVTDGYELVAYDGNDRRLLFYKRWEGYQPSGARIVHNRLIVYVEDYPSSTTLYGVSLNGSRSTLGRVGHIFDGIAWRDYLFVRTKHVETIEWGVYDYYIRTGEGFSWLAGGHLWLDYFNGTLLLVEWGDAEVNETLVRKLGFRVVVSKVGGVRHPARVERNVVRIPQHHAGPQRCALLRKPHPAVLGERLLPGPLPRIRPGGRRCLPRHSGRLHPPQRSDVVHRRLRWGVDAPLRLQSPRLARSI